jgi:hypothetical protein
MQPLPSTIVPPLSYRYGNKLDKPQENDQSSDSKGKRGKLGFQFVLKKCASFRSLSNKNDSSIRTMTTESALSSSSSSLSVESVVACQVAVRVEAPSSSKLLLPTNGATIKRPGLLYRSCSVQSLRVESPREVRRKGKRMDLGRSHSARQLSTNLKKVQTRSPENAKNKSSSLLDFLQEYDDIIILDEYAQLTPARQQMEESSVDDCLDAYLRIVDEDTD